MILYPKCSTIPSPQFHSIPLFSDSSPLFSDLIPFLSSLNTYLTPLQVPIIFLQKMDMLLKKTSPDDVKRYILPMIITSLEANSSQLQVRSCGATRK